MVDNEIFSSLGTFLKNLNSILFIRGHVNDFESLTLSKLYNHVFFDVNKSANLKYIY